MADRICSVEGCERPWIARRWCTVHYAKWRKYGDPLSPDRVSWSGKTCSVDGCSHPVTCRGWCNKHYLRWYKEQNPPDPAAVRRRGRKHLLKRYGLSVSEYEALVRRQRGRCAICRTAEPGYASWLVDHDHVTGQVRGLLCRACNSGIGLLRDDPDLISAAARYVRTHRQMVIPL